MVSERLLVLDKKDRELLYLLDTNCRQSNQELGRKLRMSKQTVLYRIQRLIREGYITRFASVIDTYKLGLYKIKLYLSFHDADRGKIAEITSYLIKHKKTEWVATCSGRWDVIAGFIVKTPYEFNEALSDFEDLYSPFIAKREITISLGVPHWRKEYLLDNRQPFSWVQQGGALGNRKIDKTDESIIKLVVNNARMPIVRMAKHLGLTTRIVDYRMRLLRKEGVIVMHRIFLNLPKLGFIFAKAIIKFKNLTKQRYGEFFNACSDQPNLTYLINCIGSWDVELDFEVPDFNTFHRIMLDLRDRFADIIASYDFVMVMKEEKLDYYPGAMPVMKY